VTRPACARCGNDRRKLVAAACGYDLCRICAHGTAADWSPAQQRRERLVKLRRGVEEGMNYWPDWWVAEDVDAKLGELATDVLMAMQAFDLRLKELEAAETATTPVAPIQPDPALTPLQRDALAALACRRLDEVDPVMGSSWHYSHAVLTRLKELRLVRSWKSSSRSRPIVAATPAGRALAVKLGLSGATEAS